MCKSNQQKPENMNQITPTYPPICTKISPIVCNSQFSWQMGTGWNPWRSHPISHPSIGGWKQLWALPQVTQDDDSKNRSFHGELMKPVASCRKLLILLPCDLQQKQYRNLLTRWKWNETNPNDCLFEVMFHWGARVLLISFNYCTHQLFSWAHHSNNAAAGAQPLQESNVIALECQMGAFNAGFSWVSPDSRHSPRISQRSRPSDVVPNLHPSGRSIFEALNGIVLKFASS